MHIEGDRLSYLPDDLIHKIFSFIDIKQAIEASALSSRWRYIWTSMPYLNFSTKDFHTFATLSKFITCVLSGRNNRIQVSSIKLTFQGTVNHTYVQRVLNVILNNEFSYNVQQLNVTCLPGGWFGVSPLSVFSSQSLKHLTLVGCTDEYLKTTTTTWELPTLTTLYLHLVTFYVDNTTKKHANLFSNFPNLKNLNIKHCNGLNAFRICHPRLSSLTLEDGRESCNVVTPQLKNLTIRHWGAKHMIFAPNLMSFHYKGYYYPLELSAGLRLEKVDLCISSHSYEDIANGHNIFCLLQQLHSVKFLTINLETIKFLSSFVELILPQPSPFVNLRSLKIYPADVTLEKQTQPKITMPTEVKNYLLDGSPGATFTIVSHEEIRAVMSVAAARNLMRELRVLLDQWKENSETNTAHMKEEKATMGSHNDQVEVENHRAQPDTIMKSHFREKMAHINEQLKKGYKNTDRAFSILQATEEVLRNLPTSLRAKLQARFSSLCAEAETIVDTMVNDLKIQCDEKPRLYFYEPATASHPSS